jgi:muconolactone delta-isomerase
MRFLVISNPKFMTPPEIIPGLSDAMSAWIAQNSADGKLETAWSFAGQVGGGGILNVESAEELDAIMIGYPFGPFSDVEVYALADLEASLQGAKAAAEAAIQAIAGGG